MKTAQILSGIMGVKLILQLIKYVKNSQRVIAINKPIFFENPKVNRPLLKKEINSKPLTFKAINI